MLLIFTADTAYNGTRKMGSLVPHIDKSMKLFKYINGWINWCETNSDPAVRVVVDNAFRTLKKGKSFKMVKCVDMMGARKEDHYDIVKYITLHYKIFKKFPDIALFNVCLDVFPLVEMVEDMTGVKMSGSNNLRKNGCCVMGYGEFYNHALTDTSLKESDDIEVFYNKMEEFLMLCDGVRSELVTK